MLEINNYDTLNYYINQNYIIKQFYPKLLIFKAFF